MASATLCFSGFSREELPQVQQQFEQANGELGNSWSLATEADARVLVIDMDSMYGHMTWLKAAGSGKKTVGLTAGERCETDYLLKRPMSPAALRSVLEQIAAGQPASAPTEPSGESAASAAPTAAAPDASASAETQEPAATSATPPQPQAGPAQAQTAPATPKPAADPAADYMAAVTTGQMAAMQPMVAHEPRISDFLTGNALGGPSKVQLPGAPLLAFDPATQTYAGAATLKPLMPYMEAILSESDFTAIDGAEFERIKAASGGAQPYMRLLWLCGLSVGRGRLLPGTGPGKKFVLTKWPQIEREYPKHFRLATVMMKGPATINELSEQSGVPEPDVIDFVNAGLVTGWVVAEGTVATASDVRRACALLAKPRPA